MSNLTGRVAAARQAWLDATEPDGELNKPIKPGRPLPDFRSLGNGSAWVDWHPAGATLLKIQRRKPCPGAAGRLLDLLCAIADRHDVAISGNLEPYEVAGVGEVRSAADLAAWYKRRGFVVRPNKTLPAITMIERSPRMPADRGESGPPEADGRGCR